MRQRRIQRCGSTRVFKPLSSLFVRAIRASALTQVELARAAGYPNRVRISLLVRERTANTTPLSIDRLHKLAEAIGYEGPVFRG